MANLLSGGVLQGLAGASASMKVADTAMCVYEQKKAKGDEEGMKRAFGYATEHMDAAMEATEESKEALAENVKAAREQEKAEREEMLEKARKKSADKAAEDEAAVQEAADQFENPHDVLEISPEAALALKNAQTPDTQVEEQPEAGSEHPEP